MNEFQPVDNVDNRPKASEPKQSDAVEAEHYRRRIRAALERPQSRPPLLTLADIRAAEASSASAPTGA